MKKPLLAQAIVSISAIAVLLWSASLLAQSLPVTEVWLAEIQNGLPTETVKISGVTGYNNQPMFSPDGRLVYFTSEQEGQTDIAEFSIETKQLRLILNSPESEYSPTPIPERNAVSVIRVEPPENLQRLWAIDIADGGLELLMPNVEPVGYHSWIEDDSVAVFILGDTFSLHLAQIGPDESTFLADNIGRTIRKHPKTGNILFVDKNVAPWAIASFNPDTQQLTVMLPLHPGIEDFEVDSQGRYWMGSGSKLYRSNAGNNSWELTVDYRSLGFTEITRLASSPNGKYLALVAGR